MRLFGDPKYPRRNLGGGSILLALTWFQVGSITEHMFSSDITTNDYIDLAIWLVLAVLAAIGVRRDIARLPPDPKDEDAKTSRVDRSAV